MLHTQLLCIHASYVFIRSSNRTVVARVYRGCFCWWNKIRWNSNSNYQNLLPKKMSPPPNLTYAVYPEVECGILLW